MSIVVLSLAHLPAERRVALTESGYAVMDTAQYPSRAEAIANGNAAVRAVITTGHGGLSGPEMELLPNLEVVCTIGAGYEAVDLDMARRRGIAVANSPDTNATSVADAAMMLLLAVTRQLLQADRHVRRGGWQAEWRGETPVAAGKRLGILGLGTIGSRIAYRAARGFDMEVGYHNRKPVPQSPYRYFDDLVELAAWADFLVVSAPGGAETRHLVNAKVLAALGPKGLSRERRTRQRSRHGGVARSTTLEADCGRSARRARGQAGRLPAARRAAAIRERGHHAA